MFGSSSGLPSPEKASEHAISVENNTMSSPKPLIDNRLRQIDIVRWIKVPISNDLAARVISLYFEIDYPVLPLFDADLFIDDLVNLRTRFCSPLLIISLLCWACVCKPLEDTAS